VVADHLQHGQMADQIRLCVGERVLDRIADAGLGGQVDHRADVGWNGSLEGGVVGDVAFDEAKAVSLCQQRQTVALEGDGIIVVQVVDASDGDALVEQRVGDMEADEAGGAGQEDMLGARCLHGGLSIRRPRNVRKRKPFASACVAGNLSAADVLLLHPPKAP
jgi:hypothetical protein